jgi:hypothetical protein
MGDVSRIHLFNLIILIFRLVTFFYDSTTFYTRSYV